MPKEIEDTLIRKISKFLWDGASAMVSLDTMTQPIEQGGKKILDIRARNKAIELMKLKSYLDLRPDRPKWAKVADGLIAGSIPKAQLGHVRDEASRQNVFLVMGTGNPGVSQRLPRPVPSPNPYPDHGYGFGAGTGKGFGGF